MAGIFDSLKNMIAAPKRKQKTGGTGNTPTYDPNSNTGVVDLPTYRNHLTDIFESRSANDSRALLQELFKYDTDVSATVSSYLVLAGSVEPLMYARDLEHQIDPDASRNIHSAFDFLTRRFDYTQGYEHKYSLQNLCDQMRYMALLRGSIAVELVYGKNGNPSGIRLIDTSSLEWYEKTNGEYKPQQTTNAGGDNINLDLPTIFYTSFQQDPTSIYTVSHFVSAINTIAARQQVINDLYRIMQLTGFPRVDITVLEEILLKNAPANIREDKEQLRQWMNSRFSEIQTQWSNVRADQAWVHTDATEAKVINEKNPSVGIDISSIVDTLNSQNQAGLKTLPTVIGRGQQGVNTASVEARISAMNADALNVPVADILKQIASYLLHTDGFAGFAEVAFQKIELRPSLELEPQRVMMASRLKDDLSLGLITDDEYHIRVYGRLRPANAPILQGTNFTNQASAQVDVESISPNSDPLGRSLAPEGSESARSNEVN